ncbi:MAG: cob(I)yrinic acid a,c-diamide adenosyltransferase [Gallionellaceae bacterium]|jgi:cob(I)alamin adenosyltransferase|nr:cob(I)yrinic acid a,c-diamide adenosyltransferase [Gallionellaceae bacterium]
MTRLDRIVTRGGDGGLTRLADGRQVAKDDARIDAIGSVDELNSHLGVLLAEDLPTDVRELLLRIQNDLFDLGGALALPERAQFPQAHLAQLDAAIEQYNADLPPLKEFILPGGSRAAALCHVARSVARRAERAFATLARSETLPPNGLPYLNRLSDLLFVLCRVLNRAAGKDETLWRRD